ncbi:MAG: hypothetical protein KC419_21250 [Anaerolineales bacterium]|nr:hypothetical protein [Anaerolineales bacterium]
MRKLLIILLICIAVFLVVPFALGAGYASTGGDLSPTLWSNLNEYEVSGDGNFVVSVAGDDAHVTATTTEPQPQRAPLTGSLIGGCIGGVLFMLIVSLLIGGMIVIGRQGGPAPA